MSFASALSLAPLRKGYGPTAVLDGKAPSPLTPDSRTLAHIDFADTTTIELTTAQADTTFLVGFAPFSVPSSPKIRIVTLPNPAACVGKTFRFELRGAPSASCTLSIRTSDTTHALGGNISSFVLTNPTSNLDVSLNGTITISSDAMSGDWVEVYALTPKHFVVRGVAQVNQANGVRMWLF